MIAEAETESVAVAVTESESVTVAVAVSVPEPVTVAVAVAVADDGAATASDRFPRVATREPSWRQVPHRDPGSRCLLSLIAVADPVCCRCR